MNKRIEEIVAEWVERYPDDIDEFVSSLIVEISNILSQQTDKTWQSNYRFGWEAAIAELKRIGKEK
jgi:hypothetical protein